MTSPESFPKSDAGSGSYKQYKYDLLPANKRVTMRLAGSDPCQEELRRVALSTVEAFIEYTASPE